MNLQTMRTFLRHIDPTIVGAGLLIGALILLSAGCGVKAPPVPPDTKPPGVATLTYTLENGTLVLSWTLAAGSPTPQSYTFYRSRVPLADTPCEGCPLVFTRLKTVPADGRESGSEAVSLEQGYHYGFKMTATDANGLEGPDSRTVSFSY